MKVIILQQSFLIYAGNLLPYLYNNKEKRENFKELTGKDWGSSVIAVGRITRAVNIAPGKTKPIIEYGVTK